MKQLLSLITILWMSILMYGQSTYEVPVNIPPYDSNNSSMFLITTSNSGWSQINNPAYQYFYVQPGNYYDSIGTISLTTSGTPTNKRYISLHNGNDIHPGKLNTVQLANVAFSITSDYWVIDRMAHFTTNVGSVALHENANNNVVNRLYALNCGGVGYRNNCDGNTVQNCRMEVLDRTVFPDRPAFGMINHDGSVGHMVANAQITNTHVLNNEVYNYVDGFQTVLHDYNAVGNVTGVNYEGTIVDYNHFYCDAQMYTNCNGTYNENGICAYSENGIDLKCGSENPNNPMIISNNKMWGYKKSDQTNSNLSDWGAAIVVHYGVNNTEISNNVIFNSDRGIELSGTIANLGTVPTRTMLNSKIDGNIVYDIKGHAYYQAGTTNMLLENNLFKKICTSGYWAWGTSATSALGATCTNFTFQNNMIVEGNGSSGVGTISSGGNYSGNQYYQATAGSYSGTGDVTHTTDPTASYCDLVFTTDNYTNNPWTITIPKVLSPAQCVPCSPTSSLASDTACFSYVWAINGQSYTTSGTYTNISSINGCAHTDSLILTIDNSCPQPTGLYLEAECADSIGSYWSEITDVNASNGKYLVAQSGIWNTDSTSWNGTYAQLALAYSFSVNTAGAYYFNVRAITSTVSSDSFWFRVNGGAWIYWDIMESTSLAWFQYGTVNLQAGTNLLEIYFREGDFVLDKLSFNAASDIPFNMGGNATNCNNCSPTSTSQTESACQSYAWSVDGQTYTTSGTYVNVSTNGNGCTHTDSLILILSNSTTSSQTESACQSYMWSENGQTYTTSGTYTNESTNANGCTHVASLVLTINSSTTSSQTESACQSYVWSENGQTYTASGTYTDVSTNANGCAHTSSLVLTINNSTTSSQTESACQSYVWSENGQTYTASGTYIDVSTNTNGCVHTASLVLTISNSTTSSQTESACQSYVWSENGQTYTASGTYTDVSSNANGCTHTTSLVLVISNSTSSTQTVSTCNNYTWAVNGTSYTNSGTYINTVSIGSGCVQVDTLELTLGLVDNTVTATSAMLESNNQFGATYQWMDCISGALIAGQTARVFVPIVNGTYAVIVTDAGCTDTSSCYSVYGVGVEEEVAIFSKVYPNPTTGILVVELSNQNKAIVEIFNNVGELIFQDNLTGAKSKIDISKYASGVYTIRVYNTDFDERLRVVKN